MFSGLVQATSRDLTARSSVLSDSAMRAAYHGQYACVRFFTFSYTGSGTRLLHGRKRNL